MRMIRNLVFDFGGVIAPIDFDRAVRAFGELAPGAAGLLDPYEQRGFFLDLERGAISDAEYIAELGRLCGRPFTWDEVQRGWKGFFAVEPPAEQLAMLDELRGGYRLYVLSNTNNFVMSWARSTAFSPAGRPLDSYFDRLFLSFELKLTKPDAAIFRRLLADTGALPAETLFIDDGARNVEAAAALGFRTFRPENGVVWCDELRRILAADR